MSHRSLLRLPLALVPARELVEVAGRRGGIVHPLAQGRPAIDEIDGETRGFVLVGKFAPERIVGPYRADRLEGESDQPPGPELRVVVAGIVDVDLDARAELAGVLVEG